MLQKVKAKQSSKIKKKIKISKSSTDYMEQFIKEQNAQLRV